MGIVVLATGSNDCGEMALQVEKDMHKQKTLTACRSTFVDLP